MEDIKKTMAAFSTLFHAKTIEEVLEVFKDYEELEMDLHFYFNQKPLINLTTSVKKGKIKITGI